MNKFLVFLSYIFLFFATFYLLNSKKDEQVVTPQGTAAILIEPTKDSYAVGKDIRFDIQNNTQEVLTLSLCPTPPFQVLRFNGKGYEPVTSTLERDCSQKKPLEIAAGQTGKLSLLDYAYSYFSEPGTYKVELTQGEEQYLSPDFEIHQASWLVRGFRTLIYTPILNVLVALLLFLPGHNLGLAIIILTFVIRTILLKPSLDAAKSQKKMQALQPKLDALKKKYGDDQMRLSQETMKLWSENKVHPLSSCLPMLIQFPILIALFYTINGGLSPDRSFLIYDFLPDFNLGEINPHFLGLNLFTRNLIFLPIIVGGMQFAQMQLMSPAGKKKDAKQNMPEEMVAANNMMKYMMPVMIALFTAQLPAAVGLYWGTSTFYGVIQQLVVNKEGPRAIDSSDGEVKVRVINKNHGK